MCRRPSLYIRMAEENKEPETTLDEQAMLSLLAEANALQRGKGQKIVIDGKVWHVRPTSQRQNLKMLNLDYDVLYWQNELKSQDISRRKAKRLNAKIRKAYAKKAAHKVLGKWLWLIPFAFALTWRRIYNASEQVSATINSEEALMSENQVFYLANLGSSKQALGRSTIQVGNAKEQRTQRMESAENMVKEDGLPKTEDNK